MSRTRAAVQRNSRKFQREAAEIEDAWAQNIYVADLNRISFDPNDNAGVIYEYTPEGARREYAAGFTRPLALAFDPEGNLYVGDLIRSAIFQIRPNGDRLTFATHVSPYALATDRAGNLYMFGQANFDFDTDIWKFAPDGSSTSFAGNLHFADSLAFDAPGNLWSVDNHFIQTGAQSGYYDVSIVKHTPGGEHTVFISGLDYATGLAFGKQGELYYSMRGSILKFTGEGTNTVTFASGFTATKLAADAAGNLFATVGPEGSAELVRLGAAGERTVIGPTLAYPTAIAFAPPPQVEVSESRGRIILKWPRFANGFTLETSSDLNGKVWTTVPTTSGATTVTMFPPPGAGYFRMRK